MTRAVWKSLIPLMALASAAATCGIPTNESAQIIEDPPPELFEALPETTSTTEPEPEARVFNLRLYWHTDNDSLVVITRSFSDESPQLSEALEALTQGPSEEELATDSSTLIQTRFSVALAPRFIGVNDEGTAVIRVADEAEFREATDRRLAAAEIVCTAVQFDRVDSVIIEDSLGSIPLTDSQANPIEGPATAADYDNCESPIETAETNEQTTTSDSG